MTGYLRRLATTGAAYTASSVISKLIAVALLPLYTAYLTPADYGAAEVLIVAVIAASIVIRLGIIEALLRFYYERDEDPDRVVKTGFSSLFWTTTLGLAIALPLAEPVSQLLLDRSDPELVRIASFGLWVFTMYEFLLALFRLDERAKAFFAFTVSNVLVTGRTIEETILLEFTIREAGIRELSFLLPESLKEARISAPLLRQKSVTPVEDAALPAGAPRQVSSRSCCTSTRS